MPPSPSGTALLRLALLAVALIVGAFLIGTLSSTEQTEAGSALGDCRFEFVDGELSLVCDEPPLPTVTPTPSATPTPPEDETDTAEEGQPNIIVIYTDDQRWTTLDLMPNVQSLLRADGVTFTNSFVTTPLCCPSRASLFSGMYTHDHGVWDNDPPNGGLALFDEETTLATALDDAGYTTALIGKYLNGYGSLLEAGDATIPPGWDHWVGQGNSWQYNYLLNVNGTIESHGEEREDYSPAVLTQHAVDFLATVEEPFFLMLSLTVPHAPADSPPDSTCPGRIGKFPSRQDCAIEAADRAVSAVVAALGDSLDQTMIIYTSDNGMTRNEHGRARGKNCPYDHCLRVPLVISYPPLVSAAGSEENELVLNLDLTATILDLAGGTLPGLDGQSLLPLLSDPSVSVRQDFLFEMIHAEGSAELNVTDGVRTKRWKLIVRPDASEELYNLRRDPGELNNQASRPKHAALLADLRARLSELRLE